MERPALPGDEILRPRVVAVVQARMSSSRLLGKSLLPLGSATVLACVVSRLRRARALDAVCVATSTQLDDDAIARACGEIGAEVYRGSRDDVLARFVGAARATAADVVVRITADCPLVEPRIVDDVCAALARGGADYASNVLDRTFPRGLDVEAIAAAVLERVCDEAVLPHEREHVTPYIYTHPERFAMASVTDATGARRGDWRWTLDTPEDYRFLRAVEEELRPLRIEDARLEDVVAAVERRPDVRSSNAHVKQKALGE